MASPPGRFSTTTGLPQRAVSRSANSRAPISAPLPGPSGTMKRTLRWGQDVCAEAIGIAMRSERLAQTAQSTARVLFMVLPQSAYPARTAARRIIPSTRPVQDARDCVALPVLDEGAVVQLRDRLLQLSLGVHHDRAVPRDRLLDGLARDQQEADAFVSGLDRHLVTAVKQNQGSIASALADNGLARGSLLLREDAERT